ncbi:DUF3828 domain-containing protein [Alistipes sp.]|uniref:DUF3828 domain-containing protein n=1 Tax=Alistipes sp. TaxID=1872444 RepID=UPI003AF0F69C
MKRRIALWIACCFLPAICSGGCPDRVRANGGPEAVHAGGCPERVRMFYAAYLTDLLQEGSRRDSLLRTFLTPELVAKLERVSRATGADPIIRAQDTTPDALRTLTVREQGNDWYLVGYRTDADEAATSVEIPVRTGMRDGACRIVYITPPWHGSRCGDELLACPQTAPEIDAGTASSFLSGFYTAYLSVYCAMPADLDDRLAALRSRCLTQNAREEWVRAEAGNRLDGAPGYDLMIGQFDFDPLWLPTLEIVPQGNDRFRVSYRVGDRSYRIEIALTCENGKYLIDDVQM